MKNKIYRAVMLTSAFAIVGCVSIALWSPRSSVSPAPVIPEPDLQNDESLQRSCATLFRQIIFVQDDREQKRQLFEGVQLAFNEGSLEDVEFKSASALWLKKENELATQAAHMYEQGRSMGCFQKVTQ